MSSFQNIVCPIHREPIGGVCDEISCDNPHTLMCMKCVNNVNSCVRKNNHQSISLEEFVDNYFNIRNKILIKFNKKIINLINK